MSTVVHYWEDRYARGGGSGKGSRGRQANRKAAYINRLIAERGVQTLIDWGCGDGQVASRIRVPRYIGLEVSETALDLCHERVTTATSQWLLYDGFTPPDLPRADLALSLDVIFHLTEEALYRRHLELVFESAPLVCIASSNRDEQGRSHVRHRAFTRDVPAGWRIIARPPAGADGDIGFWVFKRRKRVQ